MRLTINSVVICCQLQAVCDFSSAKHISVKNYENEVQMDFFIKLSTRKVKALLENTLQFNVLWKCFLQAVWINFSRPACVYFLGMDVQWFAVA
jgi:hypothetical protein